MSGAPGQREMVIDRKRGQDVYREVRAAGKLMEGDKTDQVSKDMNRGRKMANGGRIESDREEEEEEEEAGGEERMNIVKDRKNVSGIRHEMTKTYLYIHFYARACLRDV